MTWYVYTKDFNMYSKEQLADARPKAQASFAEHGDVFSIRVLDFQHFLRELGVSKFVGVHDNHSDTAYWFDPRHPKLHVVHYRDGYWYNGE